LEKNCKEFDKICTRLEHSPDKNNNHSRKNKFLNAMRLSCRFVSLSVPQLLQIFTHSSDAGKASMTNIAIQVNL